MRVGLIDVDGHGKFPNLALMKISAYHKAQGDDVEWYSAFGERYSVVYMARNIVACACPMGGVVYDPFMGSGTTALAVLMERGKRSYIGSEISERYVAMAERKLKDYRQQLTLF